MPPVDEFEFRRATVSEQERISEAVNSYFVGMMYGNKTSLQTAFHKDASIIGNLEGKLNWMSRDAFANLCKAETTLADGDPFEASIESIDITGDNAVAKVVNHFLGTWYTDYLSLLRTNGQWQIVNKIYHAHPKT